MEYFTGNIPTPANGFTLRVDYTVESNVATNSSVITAITGKVKRNDSTFVPQNTSKVATLKIERLNDSGSWVVVKTLSNTSSYYINSNSYFTWVSGSNIQIPHKADGSQQIRLTFTVDGKLSNYYPKGSITRTITLETLHTPPAISGYTISETNSALSGVANDVFVANLSKKKFTINAEFFDEATAERYRVLNRATIYGSETNEVVIDLTQNTLLTDVTNTNKIPILTSVIDTMGGISYYPENQIADLYDYIPYVKPTLIDTSTTAKRNGQTSGKVLLNVLGNYYNGVIGNTNQSGSYKPTIQYHFWENGTEEPTTWLTISSDNVSISNGEFSVTNLEIGNDDTSASNYFDYQKSYKVNVRVNDNFYIGTLINPKSIPVGKATWTEYKDRVDFKKLTIQGLDMMDAIFFKKGDTFESSYQIYANGLVTSSTRNVAFSIVVPKRLDNIETITCNSLNLELRGMSGYLNSSSGYTEYVGNSAYTITCTKASETIISIILSKSSAFTNVTNNTPVSVRANVKFTFN